MSVFWNYCDFRKTCVELAEESKRLLLLHQDKTVTARGQEDRVKKQGRKCKGEV